MILDLLNGRHQPPSILVDDLDDVNSMQAQASSANHLKNEISGIKIEHKCYQAFIVVFFFFFCLSYFMMKCKVLEYEKEVSLTVLVVNEWTNVLVFFFNQM
ncbi:hypothetical protein EUGRSUZ_E02526 [Eucalyptus grandis]|uniref:Uncharacterized protein n=2 Tax=Eucalyptus grandis TaxID=71139 RepID=A0ACC3KW75_EUCGR|nr:hypothetical protein EUGRSUZ_E02526 [Eucalyptus grandis]